MNLEQIKKAVEAGQTVCCGGDNYIVVKDSLGQWFIKCVFNDYYIGLTHRDNVTLNDKESEFYINPN